MRWIVCMSLFFGPGLAALRAGEPTDSTEAAAEAAYNEKVLRNAGIDPGGPGLVAFFRSRVLHPDDLQRLKTAIKDLSDDSFDTREKASEILVKAGHFSLPLLRAVVKDDDLERSKRIVSAIETIEKYPERAVVTAAAQLAAARRPAGMSEALLACLPWIEDEMNREAIYAALLAAGKNGGKNEAVVMAAVKDKEPRRRAAAAYVLGQGNPEAQQLAVSLLKDADAHVRFFASRSLVQMGEVRAVPVLIAQISEGPPSLGRQAEDMLRRMAGDQAPNTDLGKGDATERLKSRQAWEKWWQAQGAGFVINRAALKEETKDQLLIVSARDGDAHLFLINPDGREVKKLTAGKSIHSYPAWSPDKKSIAFTSESAGEVRQIFVMDARGGNVKQLTRNNAMSRLPSWSPDSKTVAFCRKGPANAESVIMLMDADGKNVRPVGNGDGWDPAFSPDGKKILFTSRRLGGGFRLFVMDADGSNVKHLAGNGNPIGSVYPSWSPDGNKILWTDRAGDGALELFSADADGANRRQLTSQGGTSTYAAWSPDGRKIAYYHQVAGGKGSLCIMDPDGGNRKELLKGEAFVDGGRPMWRPR
jgi:TolB protein